MDCDWEYIKTLRTLKEPHEPMSRLKDLLEYLAKPGLEDIWVLLDIKVALPGTVFAFLKGEEINWEKLDNDAENVFRLLGVALTEVKSSRPWNERILIGCWAVSYISYFLFVISANRNRQNTFPCAPSTFLGIQLRTSVSTSTMPDNSSRFLAWASTCYRRSWLAPVEMLSYETSRNPNALFSYGP